jgi:hypothetical protein
MAVNKFLSALITVAVGVLMLPVVQGFIDGANATGGTQTLLSLIPIVWVIACVSVAVGMIAYKK